tara:strand:+ start:689 stop:1033 length:345 start_codon:yes stop_codon:yes gene_type:complete
MLDWTSIRITKKARLTMSKAPVGSKANPSEFDVLSKLGEDEPYFVIRAHDPLSSALVELHAYIGAGQAGAAHNKLAEIMALTSARAPRPASSPKYRETFAISLAMEQWRDQHQD